MASTKTTTQKPTPQEQQPYAFGFPAEPCYVVLPPAPYDQSRRRRSLFGYGALMIAAVFLIFGILYIFWPSEPSIQVVGVNLNNFSFYTFQQPGSTIPQLFLNVSMWMSVKMWNGDYYGLDYDSLKVGIGYRDRNIGFVDSQSGHLSARSTDYVNATLDLEGIEVLHDISYILEDLDQGKLPLDTVVAFDGGIKMSFVKISLQEVVSCEVVVNPSEQTIINQDCDLE